MTAYQGRTPMHPPERTGGNAMLRNASYIAAALVAAAAILAALFIVLALAAFLPLAN